MSNYVTNIVIFEIDPVERDIINLSSIELVQHDHNSTRIGFKIPRYVNDHDVLLCDNIEVHYINIAASGSNRKADVYNITDLAVDEDPEYVVFSWLISKNATSLNGKLNFSVHLGKIGENEQGEPIETYIWNTEIISCITINQSIKNDPSTDKETADTLLAIEAEINDLKERIAINKDAALEEEEFDTETIIFDCGSAPLT